MREEQLLIYLKTSCAGRKSRVSSTELEQVLHIRQADLRKLVNRLRRKGNPICSDRNGYFYAVTAGEVYATIRQLREMENGLKAAIGGLEQSLNLFHEQQGENHGEAAFSVGGQ